MAVNVKKSPFLRHSQASFLLWARSLLSAQWTRGEKIHQEILLLRRWICKPCSAGFEMQQLVFQRQLFF